MWVNISATDGLPSIARASRPPFGTARSRFTRIVLFRSHESSKASSSVSGTLPSCVVDINASVLLAIIVAANENPIHTHPPASAGSPLSTLSRAQDGSRIPKSCVRLWKTPTHEGPDRRTAVLLDREERVPTRCGENRLGQLLDTAALWPRRLRS